MARVEIVFEGQRLSIVEIVGVRYPVLRERPADLGSLGPVEELEDGRKLGTGFRQLGGQTRTVAWWADEDEVNKIHAEWREAIERSTIPVDLAWAMVNE